MSTFERSHVMYAVQSGTCVLTVGLTTVVHNLPERERERERQGEYWELERDNCIGSQENLSPV
jgi:hypothetical protein